MARHKLRGEIKYPKERLLFEIYRMRGLTLAQITKAIIGSYDYTFEYMTNLEKEGYVQGKLFNAGKRRLGKLFTITDKGIEMLVSANLLEQTLAPTQSNTAYLDGIAPRFETSVQKNGTNSKYKPKQMNAYENNQRHDKFKVIYTLLTNELYAEITSYGMHFYDSREWKTRQKLNRNSITRGGFCSLSGEEYSLYVLFSPEQAKTANVSENMIKRIVEEMNTFQQGGNHVIYVYDDEKYDWIVEQINQAKVNSSSVHIIRHSNGEGYERLRLLSDSTKYEQTIQGLIQTDITEIPHDSYATRYATHQFELKGEKYYLLNYLTRNEGAMLHLKREFTPERSRIEKAKVAVLAWRSDAEELKRSFAMTEHIKVRLIEDSELQAMQYVQEQRLSESDEWVAASYELNQQRMSS